MPSCPEINPASPLLFVINAASGSNQVEVKRQAIEQTLQAGGRTGELLFCQPGELEPVARQAAARALATRTAVVAVGGDGTLNAVAQAAHAIGCPMGVIAQGTFNYFARTHVLPVEPAEATRVLLTSQPVPVQVAAVNDRVFLVNASLGLYPDLLEDRERYKSRFGRSRWVALGAAFVTMMGTQRRLNLRITHGGKVREVHTLTLFVGNNRLQLEQVGVPPDARIAGTPGAGSVAAVMLRPIGALAMCRLLLRGALGTLGEDDSVERFEFSQLLVRPSIGHGRRRIKIAYDGEVNWMRGPILFQVLPEPLYLLKPAELKGAPAE
ncbi:MAG: diacylglycerol kinase family protein [Pseudomonadota bacterium]